MPPILQHHNSSSVSSSSLSPGPAEPGAFCSCCGAFGALLRAKGSSRRGGISSRLTSFAAPFSLPLPAAFPPRLPPEAMGGCDLVGGGAKPSSLTPSSVSCSGVRWPSSSSSTSSSSSSSSTGSRSSPSSSSYEAVGPALRLPGADRPASRPDPCVFFPD